VPILVVDQTTGAVAPAGAPRNNCLLPAALVYDPLTNPTGTRCGDPDLAAASGARPPAFLLAAADVLADRRQRRHPVWSQCAPRRGDHAEEFVTLNEKIGGTDATRTHREPQHG